MKIKKELFKTTVVAVFIFAIMIIAIIFCGGCGNKDLFDIVYTYDKAIIKLANGEVVETKIKNWTVYDGGQLQVTAEDGTVYLTSSFRCDLIKTKEECHQEVLT